MNEHDLTRVAAAAAELCERAAELIDRDGLHRHEYWPGASTHIRYSEGMACSVTGALAVCSGARTGREAELVISDELPVWLALHRVAEVVVGGSLRGTAPLLVVLAVDDEPETVVGGAVLRAAAVRIRRIARGVPPSIGRVT